jgi:hypothetical protein
MPITFDTLEELKDFYQSFRLDENAPRRGRALKVRTKEDKSANGRGAKYELDAPKSRGRKPGRKKSDADKPAAKRGAKPKSVKVTKAKKDPNAEPKDTLTSKIRATIQKFLDANRSFTANDIYDDLAQRETDINKQSVITSVLKQMNNHFSKVAVTERPGAGPRPVKLYNP